MLIDTLASTRSDQGDCARTHKRCTDQVQALSQIHNATLMVVDPALQADRVIVPSVSYATGQDPVLYLGPCFNIPCIDAGLGIGGRGGSRGLGYLMAAQQHAKKKKTAFRHRLIVDCRDLMGKTVMEGAI